MQQRARLDLLPTLSLAELLARYRIDQPVHEASDREQWEAKATAEVLPTRDR